MSLPAISGEFGIVADPEIRFGTTGSAWLKIRGVAKDRKNVDGKWVDGDPLFMDIIVSHGAENLFDSAVKGDSILVTGKLKSREHEGRTYYEIRADSVGVSTRWNPAKTPKSTEKAPSIDAVAKEFEATIQSDVAPF
jgi:single-stranded DNA-binding protein